MPSLESTIGKSYVSKFNKNGIGSFDDLLALYNDESDFYNFLILIEKDDLKRVELNIKIEKAMTECFSDIFNSPTNDIHYASNEPESQTSSGHLRTRTGFKVVPIVLILLGLVFLWQRWGQSKLDENRKNLESFERELNDEESKPPQSKEDLEIMKYLEGQWKFKKIEAKGLSKKEKKEFMNNQLLFVESYMRVKRDKYSDYGEGRPYEVRDGKLYELYSYNNEVSAGTAPVDGTLVFDGMTIIDEFNFSAISSKKGYGKIIWFMERILD